jgi:AcrR family transcriptional regulator
MDRPNKNIARGEATRGQLIAVATRMFAERGYEDTSIEAVLREAGVSRGSLYHHFASKEALFEAVAEDVEGQVGSQTVAASAGADGPRGSSRGSGWPETRWCSGSCSSTARRCSAGSGGGRWRNATPSG